MYNRNDLTPPQAAYLTSFLPSGYSFQPVTLESKRARPVKKLDQSFTNDFNLATPKKYANHDRNNHASNQRLNQKSPHEKREKKHSTVKDQVPVSVKQQDEQEPKSRSEQIMQKFLLRLKMNKHSWPFRMPVDPATQDVPDYYQIVKEPMDLKTIDRKIKSHQYKSQKQFDYDIRKIIANSYIYYSQDTVYYKLTKEFQNYYEQLWRQYKQDPESFLDQETEKQYNVEDKKSKVQVKESKRLTKQMPDRSVQRPTNSSRSSESRRKRRGQEEKEILKSEPKEAHESFKAPVQKSGGRTIKSLSFKQRQELLHKVQNLSQSGIKGLINMLYDVPQRGEWQQFEFDLAQLGQQKFKKLQFYLNENV